MTDYIYKKTNSSFSVCCKHVHMQTMLCIGLTVTNSWTLDSVVVADLCIYLLISLLQTILGC